MSKETEVLLKSSVLIEDDEYGNRKLRTTIDDLKEISGQNVLFISNLKMESIMSEMLNEMKITNKYLAEILGDSFKEN